MMLQNKLQLSYVKEMIVSLQFLYFSHLFPVLHLSCSLFLKSLGENVPVSYWMLAVVSLALEASSLTEMSSQCHLLPRTNMKPKFNLPLKEVSLLYLLSWAQRDFHSQQEFLMLCTVLGAGYHGTLKVGIHLINKCYVTDLL